MADPFFISLQYFCSHPLHVLNNLCLLASLLGGVSFATAHVRNVKMVT